MKKIFVVVVAFVVLACATVKSDIKVMSGAFAACAKADLGQMITPGSSGPLAGLPAQAFLTFLNNLITMNAAALEAQLGALATLVGVDAIQCALAAIEALSAPAGSATPTTAAASPGLVRAKAWLAQQGAK